MYSAQNEGQSAISERFIRTSKNKIYIHMTAVSKNVYIDINRKVKLKPIDVQTSRNIDLCL